MTTKRPVCIHCNRPVDSEATRPRVCIIESGCEIAPEETSDIEAHDPPEVKECRVTGHTDMKAYEAGRATWKARYEQMTKDLTTAPTPKFVPVYIMYEDGPCEECDNNLFHTFECSASSKPRDAFLKALNATTVVQEVPPGTKTAPNPESEPPLSALTPSVNIDPPETLAREILSRLIQTDKDNHDSGIEARSYSQEYPNWFTPIKVEAKPGKDGLYTSGHFTVTPTVLMDLNNGQHQYSYQVIQACTFAAWCFTTEATVNTFSLLVDCLHDWLTIAERHKRFIALFKDLDHLSTADLVSLAAGGKLPDSLPTYKNINKWEEAMVGAYLTPTANKPASMFTETLQEAEQGKEVEEQE